MTDEELRKLVRDAIQRHLGGAAGRDTAATQSVPSSSEPPWRSHASFGKFLVLRNDDSGACMIEPGVQCNHCGFCQSYGH
jgi:hypothetical protein